MIFTIATVCAFPASAKGNISDVEFWFGLNQDTRQYSAPRPKWDSTSIYIKLYSSTPYKITAYGAHYNSPWSWDHEGRKYVVYPGGERWMVNWIYEECGYGAQTTLIGEGMVTPDYYNARGVWSPDSV